MSLKPIHKMSRKKETADETDFVDEEASHQLDEQG